MEKCPICEVNYIKAGEDRCQTCTMERTKKVSSIVDNNKKEVEDNLVHLLNKFSTQALELLTKQDESHRLCNLPFPLLVKCNDMGVDRCREEVRVGDSLNYRYYIKPYVIKGEKYHICNHWSDQIGSKNFLKLLYEIKDKFN